MVRKLSVISEPDNVKSEIIQSMNEAPDFITKQQFDIGINSVVDKLADKLEPDSALTKEGKGFVKTVGEIHNITQALKSPTTVSMEEATSSLVTTVLGSALQNITGGGQQAPVSTPLKNTLAQLAVNNLTGAESPLPQILDALTNVLGKDKVREGYDAGMQLVEQQQTKNNLPNIVLQLNENSQEDVTLYAQQQGYSDINYAQTKLIEHKNMLLKEVEEYQRIQQGGQQVVVEEPIRNEPVVYNQRQQEQYEEPIVEEPIVEEPVVEQESIELDKFEAAKLVEKPVMKANKVIVLHSKPRKLKLAKFENDLDDNSLDDNSLDDNSLDDNSLDENKILDIDNIINELGEQNE